MILDTILETKRAEVAERERLQPLAELRVASDAAPPARPFTPRRPMGLIAEVKRRSPSAGDIRSGIDPVEQARMYEQGGASAISVLTDETYFGGTLDDLRAIRLAVQIPVLCKDFLLTHYQVYEARAHGADVILLIVAALDDRILLDLMALAEELGMTALVEVHDQHDLARALAAEARLVGINNRDLTDFSVDLLTTEYLAPLIPDDVIIVSESGIACRDDVDRVARAGAAVVLVGEALMRASEPGVLIDEMLSVRV